jgi:putative toxin-antitoxin system antitoxin component (TIGR02293 family)
MENKNPKKQPEDVKYNTDQAPETWALNEAALAFDIPASPGLRIADTFSQIAATRKGLPKEMLFDVAKMYGVTMDELSAWLMSSYRNLQRKADNELLDSYKSEKLLQLIALAEHGQAVLGSLDAFKTWVKTPLLALGHLPPSSFLDTSFGIQAADRLLGRLEWGVYS